ncbi:DUF3667 domain-containing protein [Pedobacter sp. BMA]|uniref:DUF3667 domain-containing protein n=1 Tax=Pedobacter sp. BMA TaxID=1663685 RepID=UPI00069F977D|nr:DUF3667 domain-containing protein [Pedobacter sp. BMA]
MMSSECLNCASPVSQNYCSHCGQKSSTHRYSIKHFLLHDFVHSVWHVDKGIFFTLKELFTRPGNSVREFIEGKRVPYFSFITLILLILTVSGLLAPYIHITATDLVPEVSKAMTNEFEKTISRYPKLYLIITIPIYSLLSFLWFKKAKFNYSEHLVMNSYRIIPEMLFNLFGSVVSIFYANKQVLIVLCIMIPAVFGFIYSIWFYYQFFSKSAYGAKGRLLRSVLILISFFMIPMIMGLIAGMLMAKAH